MHSIHAEIAKKQKIVPHLIIHTCRIINLPKYQLSKESNKTHIMTKNFTDMASASEKIVDCTVRLVTKVIN